MADDAFWAKELVSQHEPGGLHPYRSDELPLGQTMPVLRELSKQLHYVMRALEDGTLDARKVAVAKHPTREDTWFLRFSNLDHEIWQTAEIICWIVFNTRGMGRGNEKGRGQGEPLCFPDFAPCFGILTASPVVTAKTGAKAVCLPGMSSAGVNPEPQIWRAMWKGSAHSAAGYSFELLRASDLVRVTASKGHAKHGDWIMPNLNGSMVRYIQTLLNQFDQNCWFDIKRNGDILNVTFPAGHEGLTSANTIATAYCNGTLHQQHMATPAWNQRHLAPILRLFPPVPAPPAIRPALAVATPVQTSPPTPSAALPLASSPADREVEVKVEDEDKEVKVKAEAVELKVETEDAPAALLTQAQGPKRHRRFGEEGQRRVLPRRDSSDNGMSRLTVHDFPIGTMVWTPRKIQQGGSFCRVLKHDDGQLRVEVPGEPSGLVSLMSLKKRVEAGLPIMQLS
jgi:hypothetical protein